MLDAIEHVLAHEFGTVALDQLTRICLVTRTSRQIQETEAIANGRGASRWAGF